MNFKFYRIIGFAFLLLCFVFQVNAQFLKPEVVSSSGGSGIGSGVSLNWTIGQPIINTYVSNASTLSNGFLHGSITIADEIPAIPSNLVFKVYPNPTQESIVISTPSLETENLRYEIATIDGKLVFSSMALSSNQQLIDLQLFKNGIYLLSIFQDNKKINSFRVIKE